tara:strand:+ start:348 stop:752 length:405 start_codon:yes stop_codon:yes gene_type:complete
MWEQGDIEGYYKLVEDPKGGAEGAVEITEGPFTGMVYRYGDFRVTKPESEDAQPQIEYHFEVIDIPEEIRDVVYPDEMKESFDQMLVKILIDLVQKDASKEMGINDVSANGESDINEASEGRVLHQVSDPVSEE